MKNVKVISKGERPPFMDYDLYEYSSDITTFNLYDQEWADLEAEGLTYLFKHREELEKRKLERKGME
jgi:hypothetical protein